MVLGDIWGVKLGQDRYLLDDIFHLIFRVFHIDDLDGYHLARPSVNSARPFSMPLDYVGILVCTLCRLYQSCRPLYNSVLSKVSQGPPCLQCHVLQHLPTPLPVFREVSPGVEMTGDPAYVLWHESRGA